MLEHWYNDNMIVSTAAQCSLFWINQDRKSTSFKCLQVNVDDDVDDNNEDNFSFMFHSIFQCQHSFFTEFFLTSSHKYYIYKKNPDYHSYSLNITNDPHIYLFQLYCYVSFRKLPAPADASVNPSSSTNELDTILEELLGLGPKVCAHYVSGCFGIGSVFVNSIC